MLYFGEKTNVKMMCPQCSTSRSLMVSLLAPHRHPRVKFVSAGFLDHKVTIFSFAVDKFLGDINLKLYKSCFSSNFCPLILAFFS